MRLRLLLLVSALMPPLLLPLWTNPGRGHAVAQERDRIDSPPTGSRVSGSVEIRGTAVGPDPAQFDFYRLYYGQGPDPSVLRPIGAPGTAPVESGHLGVWDTVLLTPGEYTVLLTVYAKSRNTSSDRVLVRVEALPTPTPPSVRPPFTYPTPGEVPTPGAEAESEPPSELAPPPGPVQPVDVPPPAPPPPASIPDVGPPPPAALPPPPAPIRFDPVQPALPPPLPPPAGSDPIVSATVEPTATTGPAPIFVPPPPAVDPVERPGIFAPPTPLGLPR